MFTANFKLTLCCKKVHDECVYKQNAKLWLLYNFLQILVQTHMCSSDLDVFTLGTTWTFRNVGLVRFTVNFGQNYDPERYGEKMHF